MDFIATWDETFSDPRKRLILLVEFIEKYGGPEVDLSLLELEFKLSGSLFVVRLLSATKRAYNSAKPTDMYLRALLIFFSSNNWHEFLGVEDVESCIKTMISIIGTNPIDNFYDIEQALLIIKRLIQSNKPLEIFQDLAGIKVITSLIQSTVNNKLLKLSVLILFRVSVSDNSDYLIDSIVTLFSEPRGVTKYTALALCIQIWSADFCRHQLLRSNVSWLNSIWPQLLRLLINRPLVYQYECASFVQQLLSVPEISVITVELMNSLVALRYIVGGATIIDNDSWQFADSAKRAPSPQKSRWSVLREETPTRLENLIESGPTSAPMSARDRIMSIKTAALNISREVKKDNSISNAQDPAIIGVRMLSTILNSCSANRHKLSAVDARFISMDQANRQSFESNRVVTHVSVTISNLIASISALERGHHQDSLLFNLLSVVQKMESQTQRNMLRKLLLSTEKPPKNGTNHLTEDGNTAKHNSDDPTEKYRLLPLIFQGDADRLNQNMKDFSEDGYVVSFILILYTLQRWLDIDDVVKQSLWRTLNELGLEKVFASCDPVLDYLADFGDDSLNYTSLSSSPLPAQSRLNMYVFFNVLLRLLNNLSIRDNQTDVAIVANTSTMKPSELYARRTISRDINDETSLLPVETAQHLIKTGLDTLRHRIGGGMVINTLKQFLFMGKIADTQDKVLTSSFFGLRKGQIHARFHTIKESRRAASPFSNSRGSVVGVNQKNSFMHSDDGDESVGGSSMQSDSPVQSESSKSAIPESPDYTLPEIRNATEIKKEEAKSLISFHQVLNNAMNNIYSKSREKKKRVVDEDDVENEETEMLKYETPQSKIKNLFLTQRAQMKKQDLKKRIDKIRKGHLAIPKSPIPKSRQHPVTTRNIFGSRGQIETNETLRLEVLFERSLANTDKNSVELSHLSQLQKVIAPVPPAFGSKKIPIHQFRTRLRTNREDCSLHMQTAKTGALNINDKVQNFSEAPISNGDEIVAQFNMLEHENRMKNILANFLS